MEHGGNLHEGASVIPADRISVSSMLLESRELAVVVSLSWQFGRR